MKILRVGSVARKVNEDCRCEAHEWESSKNSQVSGLCEVDREWETDRRG